MKNFRSRLQAHKWLLSLLVMAVAVSCQKNSFEKPVVVLTAFDPSLPVIIDSFTPDSGGVSTQMLIYGSNFGTDPSKIQVFVNDKAAPVIGSTGTIIYAMVPSRAGTGRVKVMVTNGEQTKETNSEINFSYIYKPSVGTLAGFKNENNETSIVDGDIATAQFEQPYWLCFDNHKNLYLLEEYRGLRFIDSAATNVKTLFRVGNGLDRPRTLAFNPTYDTLYITNDQWSVTGLSTVVATLADSFTTWSSLIYNLTTNGSAVQPQTGDYFYNSYSTGAIFKWDRTNKVSNELFRIGDVNWEFNIQFAPSGDFAYICVVNQHYILKSRYNRQTGLLETPVHFVGTRRSAGYKDGVGTDVLFNEPHQGAFDEFDNFYVCDRVNHVIRKITPEGIVTTFAGRPNDPGYADGALRDAQFDRPSGIAYDAASGTFYIADENNARIRTIITE
ncbi:MAG: IPT/TIG domain-containing protein [Niabella sp.]